MSDPADAVVTTTRATLDRIAVQQLDFGQALAPGEVRVTGQRPAALGDLLRLVEEPPATFNGVEP